MVVESRSKQKETRGEIDGGLFGVAGSLTRRHGLTGLTGARQSIRANIQGGGLRKRYQCLPYGLPSQSVSPQASEADVLILQLLFTTTCFVPLTRTIRSCLVF